MTSSAAHSLLPAGSVRRRCRAGLDAFNVRVRAQLSTARLIAYFSERLRPCTRKRLRRQVLAAMFLLAMPATQAWAQAPSPVDAANHEFLRQQERDRALLQQQEQAPDVRLQGQPTSPQLANGGLIPGNESPCFTIERIVLVGDSAEQFQWALSAADRTENGSKDSALHRCIGTQGINVVMRRIPRLNTGVLVGQSTHSYDLGVASPPRFPPVGPHPAPRPIWRNLPPTGRNRLGWPPYQN